MEDCETGVVTKTRRGTNERDHELQGHSVDIGDVEVCTRRALSFVWKTKKNLQAGRVDTWEALMASVANTLR